MTKIDDQSAEELSESVCLGLLRTVDFGRFAVTSSDGGVDIFPVNFVVDHGTILFKSAPGAKIDRVRDVQLAAFEADHHDWYERSAWSVVVKARPSVVEKHAEVVDLFDVKVDAWHPGHKSHFVRLVPTSITGRRFTVQSSTARRRTP